MVTQPSVVTGPIQTTTPPLPAAAQDAEEGVFAQLLAEQDPVVEPERLQAATVAADVLASELEDEAPEP